MPKTKHSSNHKPRGSFSGPRSKKTLMIVAWALLGGALVFSVLYYSNIISLSFLEDDGQDVPAVPIFTEPTGDEVPPTQNIDLDDVPPAPGSSEPPGVRVQP